MDDPPDSDIYLAGVRGADIVTELLVAVRWVRLALHGPGVELHKGRAELTNSGF
jgi:hypothetical protein